MLLRISIGLALASLACAASAQEAAGKGEPNKGVAAADDWEPSFVDGVKDEELRAAYPKAAVEKKLVGEVVITCVAGAKGELTACWIKSETPEGYGFGAAALTILAAKERIKTTDDQGRSTAGRTFDSQYEFLAPGDANPNWVRKPTPQDLAAVLPTKALRAGKSGRAAIACQVTIDGFLERCKVSREDPEGYGFGAAALQLTPQFRMSPKIRGGKPVAGGEVTIPIGWDIPAFRAGGNDIGGSRALMLDPPWIATPTFAQVQAAWPAKAADAGQAALRCSVTVEGMLRSCVVISELPKGQGFGAAAQSLSKLFRIRVNPDDKKDVRGLSVDVPFRFRDPAKPDTRKLTGVRWTRTLTADGMALVYPLAATTARVWSGLGAVSCTVDAKGELTNCQAAREEPAGLDFGAAAIEAAKLMAMNPWTKEGDPVDGMRVTLPIRFVAPAAEATPAKDGKTP